MRLSSSRRRYGSFLKRASPIDRLPKSCTFEKRGGLNYIDFYNYHRIQLKTKLTPFELRCQSL
ncbi:MAG: IS3 family transposase [Anaerolineales bacterium]